MSDIFETRIVEQEKIQFNHPLVIGGFAGMSGTGFIASSYIIEQLSLHQIAHVKSPHIPPVSVFIGKKLRSPFRIYSDEKGELLVLVSEVPVDNDGMYEISTAIASWLLKIEPKDFVILDAIPTQTISTNNTVMCVANEEKLKFFTEKGIDTAPSTILVGMTGAMMNECVTVGLQASTLLTESPTNVADPGAVLSLIEALKKAYSLTIDTEVLEKSVIQFHSQLKELMEQYHKKYTSSNKSTPESMYG